MLSVNLDTTDGAYKILDHNLNVIGVRLIDLHSNVLHWVLIPLIELMLSYQHQRKRDFKQDSLHVVLDVLASMLVLDTDLD